MSEYVLIDARTGAAVVELPEKEAAERPGFTLLYVVGWSLEHNEPAGGHVIGTYPTLNAALAARCVMAQSRLRTGKRSAELAAAAKRVFSGLGASDLEA